MYVDQIEALVSENMRQYVKNLTIPNGVAFQINFQILTWKN